MDQDAEMVLQLAYVAEAWAVRDERDAEQVNKRMKTSRPVRRR
jgi:hypothetical protein